MTNPTQTQTQTERLYRLELHVPPPRPLSERMDAGAASGSAEPSIPSAHPVEAERESNIAARIRQNKQRSDERRLAAWRQQIHAVRQEAQQQITIGQIIADICTLPLSEESQQQLEQWIKDFLSTDDIQLQLHHCAVLIIDNLRPLLDQFPNDILLAHIEESLFVYISQRLPQGLSMEVFFQQCRTGLVKKAALDTGLQQLDAMGRELLSRRMLTLQQQMQSSSHQVVGTMTAIQSKRQSMVRTATAAIETLASNLQQQEAALQNRVTAIYHIAEQEESTQNRLVAQLNQLSIEAKRI